MKILAIDIGAGTEDILLYDDKKKSVENCFKMVLPSPSQVYAARVRAATRCNQDLFINGDVIGGGALTYAIKQHIAAGFRVTMTEHSAYTVRNDLDEVRKIGIQVLSNHPPTNFHGQTLTLEEVNLTKLKNFLADFDEPFLDIDVVAIAVQDHGVFPQGTSNRRFRIKTIKELLASNPRPERLLFEEKTVPPCFLRMKSSIQAAKRQLPSAKVVVMDTASAAIIGCLEDPTINKTDNVLAVNIGNGHTMAALLDDYNILGMLEHHTKLLNAEKIEQLLVAFADGKLSDEQVFNDKGHGVLLLKEPLGFSKIKAITATGPNRQLIHQTNLPVHFAAPAGDVMMTGPIGLVAATKRLLSSL